MSNHPLVFLIPLLFTFLFCLAVATSTFPLTKPNCNATCGDIQVPYPFGIGTDDACFYDQNFQLICNKSFNPPKLMVNEDNEVLNASYEGQLTVLSPISYDCYDKFGESADNQTIFADPGSDYLFTISETDNKFITLGCDTLSSITGVDRVFRTGCSMFCVNQTDVINVNDSCTGIGCCQTSVPKGLANFNLSLSSYENHKRVFHFNPCSYAFIAKAHWFNFSSSFLSKFTSQYQIDGDPYVPMVFDWAIEAKSCGEAVKNKTSYACRAKKSTCVASKNYLGYHCICKVGYQGNPYLQDGCQDIDDCKAVHNCSEIAKCKNSVGSYSCHCPLGYRGDGWNNGTSLYGIMRKKGSECQGDVIQIIAGIVASFIVLPVVIWFLYWAKKTRKRMKLFQENGGKLLMQRLDSCKKDTVDFKFFPIQEIKRATRNFLEILPVQGGFGTFFKGNLSNGKEIMVRRYPLSQSQMKDQIIQFVNEVDILSRINHKHVVKLLGCCLNTQIPMLVYEYCSQGENLPQHIQHLSWEDRLRIAAETADVLDYLHSHSIPVFHEKFESSDILLQEEKKDDGSLKLVAKVCDFKASRFAPLYQTLRGELGHKSDELEATEKSDVYCFGVVLVELLTGEKKDIPVFMSNLMKLMQEGKDLSVILDEKIAKDAEEEPLQVVAKLVMECLKARTEDRPTMEKVRKELEPFLSTSNP